ncbi:MAG TPA: ABC transporter ATP-binding protein [Gemmatimonadaceae bacterium]|nr:ABC transporter ATP-binding protein [Gemmatimonadaceae bacterium]
MSTASTPSRAAARSGMRATERGARRRAREGARTRHSSWLAIMRAFAPELRAIRWLLAAGYLGTFITVAASVVGPWPLKIIIDQVLTGRPLPRWLAPMAAHLTPAGLVIALSAAFAVIAAIGALGGTLERMGTARARERLTLILRDRLFAHLQTLPPTTIRSAHRSGELVLRLMGDVDIFARLQTKTYPLLVRYFAIGAGTLAVLAWLSPRLMLLSVLLLPPLALLVRYFGRSLTDFTHRKRRKEGEVAALAQEVVRGLPAIQAMGAEREARERFFHLNTERQHTGVEVTRFAAGMEQWLGIARGVVTAIVTGGGALLVLVGHLTLGDLTVIVSYLSQLLRPVEKVNDLADGVTRGVAGGDRLVALLALRPVVQSRPGAVELIRARGVVEMRDVSFAYPAEGRGARAVLRGVSMRLEPGQLAVLVGESGAGKSTLVHLLVRHFDPTAGQILLDGCPLSDIELASLRSQIAIMTQETHLFAGTIRQALCPAHLACSEAQLWDALRLVALDRFVRGLPAGLEAPLGEDALDLSGGQRQRMSLARAYLMNRPILILDEPLANVDPASQRIILDGLERMRAGRTCLAITHQLGLLAHADAVYRMENGRVSRVRHTRDATATAHADALERVILEPAPHAVGGGR